MTQPIHSPREPAVEPSVERTLPPTVEALRPATKPKRSSSWMNVLLGVAAFAAIAGVAFAAGRMTAPASTGLPNGRPGVGNFPGFSFDPNASFVPGGNFGGGNFPGAGLGGGAITIEGTVESKAGDTLTVKLANGQTVTVTLPADTTYHTQSAATSDAVTTGSDVLIRLDVQGGQGQGQGQLPASDVTVVP